MKTPKFHILLSTKVGIHYFKSTMAPLCSFVKRNYTLNLVKLVEVFFKPQDKLINQFNYTEYLVIH
jgi:hypothetical protein